VRVLATCRWGTDGQRPEQQQQQPPSSSHGQGGVHDNNSNNAAVVEHVEIVSDDDEPAARSPEAGSPHAAGAVRDGGGEVDAEARKALAALSQKLSPAQFRAALRDFGAQVSRFTRPVPPLRLCSLSRDTSPREAELRCRRERCRVHMPWHMRVTCGWTESPMICTVTSTDAAAAAAAAMRRWRSPRRRRYR